MAMESTLNQNIFTWYSLWLEDLLVLWLKHVDELNVALGQSLDLYMGHRMGKCYHRRGAAQWGKGLKLESNLF